MITRVSAFRTMANSCFFEQLRMSLQRPENSILKSSTISAVLPLATFSGWADHLNRGSMTAFRDAPSNGRTSRVFSLRRLDFFFGSCSTKHTTSTMLSPPVGIKSSVSRCGIYFTLDLQVGQVHRGLFTLTPSGARYGVHYSPTIGVREVLLGTTS